MAEEMEMLRRELKEAKSRITELESEHPANRDAAPEDIASRNVGVPIEHALRLPSTTDAASSVEPPVVFCTDSSPRDYIKAAKKRLGKTNVLRAGSDFIWEHEHDSGAVVRPNDKLSKKGEWTQSTFPKLQRTNEVVARIGGRWCYAGTFAPAGSENVDFDAWAALPDAAREAVISLSGRARVRRQFEGLLKDGKVRATKYRLHRIGFNEAFKTALIEASTAHILEVGREESDSADDEHE